MSGKGYYYKSATEAYICNGQGKCKQFTVGGACDSNSIGKLYNSAAVKICLSYDGTTAIDYAISAAGVIAVPHFTGSVFGTTASSQYAYVEVKADQSVIKKDITGKFNSYHLYHINTY